MKLYIINGPNLNMLGIREPDKYGKASYADLCALIEDHCKARGAECIFFQSNHEGDLVDKIQEAYFEHADGIVINPGAYTHTSIALLDAVLSVKIPTVEVHISNLSEREDFRQISYVRRAATATVQGKGFDGYLEACDILISGAHDEDKN
jgi:3-dehydroquinate dehydratase-2